MRRSVAAAAACIRLALGVCLGLSTAIAQPALRKSPYWMDVERERATLMLELSTSGQVSAQLKHDEQLFEARDETDGRVHALTFRGLTPATSYRYRLELPGGQTLGGTLRTAHASTARRARFAVYGDNRSDPAAHHAIAQAVDAFEPEFVLNTGDMVYSGGSVDDWQSFFQEARTLYAHVPLFPVLGNHELYPRAAGSRLYRRFVRTPLAAGQTEAYYAFDWGPVRVLVLNSNGDVAAGTAQRRWLDSELARARADQVPHLFAALHHGPFSSGYHGPNLRLVAQGLEDALRDAGVELVFEGHDHLYERGEAAGLKYIVTGGGGAPLYTVDRAPAYRLAFVPVHHFMGVLVDGERVTLEARLADGSLLERCSYVPGEPFVCADGSARGPVRGQQSLLHFYLHMAAPWIGLLIATLVFALWFWRQRRRHG
ncbi:MAG: hypothetical protein GXP55_16095 [Deltaproteobacteria bacterium]|nr:hypothetical protein [Deltaproteobacteria bacterium]